MRILGLKPPEDTCETCIKAKLSRPSFPPSKTIYSKPGSLIAFDTGSVKPTSFDDGNYFLTATDLATRFGHVFIMARKSEATANIMFWLKHCFNKFGYYPTSIRTDGEYTANTLAEFCHLNGIHHQFCHSPYK
jgi:hypothetical protein